MNTVEQFINNNREEFDSEEMKGGWGKIEAQIKQKKTKPKWLWWAAAASIIIFISGGVYYNYIYQNKYAETAIQPAIELPSKELTDQVDPEYTLQMDQFAHMIKIKQTELSQNKNQQPVLYRQFLKDNNQLDSSYNFLKSKLAANPNKEILLDAMIQNLQLKLELLNRQLQIIKQSKPAYRTGRHKKINNEKTI